MVLYIVAVVALAACLVFLVYTGREQKKAYQEELLQLQSKETEYVRPIRETEMESESETGDAKETEKPMTGKKTAEAILDAKEETTTEKAKETETESETETETESESELLSAAREKCTCAAAQCQRKGRHRRRMEAGAHQRRLRACLDSQLYRFRKRADPDLHKEKLSEVGRPSAGDI